MRLGYTRRARLDLHGAYAHIAENSPKSVDRMLLRLTQACAGLKDFPDQGRPGLEVGTRELVTVPPYIIVYAVGPDRIEILRVFHGAQDR